MFSGIRLNENDVFSALADEMLLSIFIYLQPAHLLNVCLVSKRFLPVANDSSLWKRFVDFDYGIEQREEELTDFEIVFPADENLALIREITQKEIKIEESNPTLPSWRILTRYASYKNISYQDDSTDLQQRTLSKVSDHGVLLAIKALIDGSIGDQFSAYVFFRSYLRDCMAQPYFMRGDFFKKFIDFCLQVEKKKMNYLIPVFKVDFSSHPAALNFVLSFLKNSSHPSLEEKDILTVCHYFLEIENKKISHKHHGVFFSDINTKRSSSLICQLLEIKSKEEGMTDLLYDSQSLLLIYAKTVSPQFREYGSLSYLKLTELVSRVDKDVIASLHKLISAISSTTSHQCDYAYQINNLYRRLRITASSLYSKRKYILKDPVLLSTIVNACLDAPLPHPEVLSTLISKVIQEDILTDFKKVQQVIDTFNRDKVLIRYRH